MPQRAVICTVVLFCAFHTTNIGVTENMPPSRWFFLLDVGQFGQQIARISLLEGMDTVIMRYLMAKKRKEAVFHSSQSQDFCCLLPKLTNSNNSQPLGELFPI